jgi:hypothetical protein
MRERNQLVHCGGRIDGTGKGASWAGCGDLLSGDFADAVGADEFAAGATAGGFFVSREEYDGLFSAGYFGGVECGADGCVVFGEPVAAVSGSDFPLLTRGVALSVTTKCHPASSWLYAPESPTVLRT